MNSAGANGVTFTPSNSNNDTASNLASDFRELHLIIPNDPLHQQMADLMSALEKATTSTRGTNRQQDGPTRMDTSPCKRKVKLIEILNFYNRLFTDEKETESCGKISQTFQWRRRWR